jgi:hypothetical protein
MLESIEEEEHDAVPVKPKIVAPLQIYPARNCDPSSTVTEL